MTLFEQFHVHILKPVAVEWDTSAALEADAVFDSQELAAVLEVAAYSYLHDRGSGPRARSLVVGVTLCEGRNDSAPLLTAARVTS